MWDKIIKVSERATTLGSIEKIESTPMIINENGVNFVVSVAKSLLKRPFNYPKPNTDNNNNNSCNISNESSIINNNNNNNNNNNINNTQKTETTPKKKFIDPFLPCDKDLFVQELYDRHNLVLNKYNVSNYHSIIATKEFENQTDPLNEFDFKAIWKCIRECNMLCFFNCGPNSGASQPHKHVQLLTTPFVAEEPHLKCPMESLFLKYKDQYETIVQIDQLPFKTAAIYYDPKKIEQFEKLEFNNNQQNSYELSNYLKNQYNSLLNHLDLNNDDSNTPSKTINSIDEIVNNQSSMEEQCKLKSYNFIMTKDWMFIVPRKNYQSNGISINSVGFTGAVLVRKDEELETLKSKGIISILKDVSFPTNQ
ncbi:hypothetical protein DICPUDRAFT_44241 [Dictyostelium purpureum]|uniref:Uncharacterized protein n=1 Tax=Dictyostelium purpureum TaxID=5786 RepID=F1A5S5_DICPU|nr:uncharacterized protein DICPUDRAFT_44241 [Dictyostelium purpureum]EGC28455.1 hypothetical protein DICPUDRAFT_44241 [Dictyostelium purpureum]|eukprot:XP_003295018.1 hypothetical protein DICPUDRAFT_44241 [Dictyostelium purpureum]